MGKLARVNQRMKFEHSVRIKQYTPALAWGTGSAIPSSNVALLNAVNVFTANQSVTGTIDGVLGAVLTNASTGAAVDAAEVTTFRTQVEALS